MRTAHPSIRLTLHRHKSHTTGAPPAFPDADLHASASSLWKNTDRKATRKELYYTRTIPLRPDCGKPEKPSFPCRRPLSVIGHTPSFHSRLPTVPKNLQAA